MKAIQIKRSGLLFKFVRKLNGSGVNYTDNICEFTREFIWATLKTLFFILFGAMVAMFVFVVGDAIIGKHWPEFMAGLGKWGVLVALIFGLTVITSGLTLIGLSIWGFIEGMEWNKERKRAIRRKQEEAGIEVRPSTLSVMFQNWKDKTCVRVDLVE